MGQARQRKLERQQFDAISGAWLLSLGTEERAIADVATRLHQRVVMQGGMTGGCYHLSFFMKRYLKKQRNIDADVVIGWVGEPSWRGVASHGWLEFAGKKIDIALSRTENPDILPTGDFILLDRVILPGAARYSYHREVPASARETLTSMALTAETAQESRDIHVRHRRMLAMVDDDEAIDSYLENTPSGLNYRTLTLLAGLPGAGA